MEHPLTGTAKTKDGLNYLVQQHRQFESLFDSFEKAPNFVRKNEIVRDIVARVSMHASMEERHLYPLFKSKLPNGNIIYKRNRMDDQMNKEILAFLEEMDAERDGELFDRTVRKFVMIENEHMQQEEQRIQELRGKMTKSELEDLEESIISSERLGPTHPHPSAPSSGLGSKIAHPLGGAMDKARDKLTGRPTQHTSSTGSK